MHEWRWTEMQNDTPPARTCIMEKSRKGSVYVFHTDDGTNWTGTFVRAQGHPPITEPVTYEHMMELKAIAEKPD